MSLRLSAGEKQAEAGGSQIGKTPLSPPFVCISRSHAATCKSTLLTHIGVAVIGRLARGLVVADKPDAFRMGDFELNTAAM
jgi:hypothetical protein